MRPYYEQPGVVLYHGDCLDVLPTLADASVDAVVTDPPYDLLSVSRKGSGRSNGGAGPYSRHQGSGGFMGMKWDGTGVAFRPETWQAVLRVLKPGGHLIAFGGTRTYHRMACAIEDAGFEVRDCLMWLFGCLSEDTEILVDGRWEPYHTVRAGQHALCYNVDRDTYEWQAIREVLVYDYSDTAYRLRGDSTDQIVSRNHRCLVERGGSYVFEYAEALERQEAVPVLEDLSGLLAALPLRDERAGSSEPDLLASLQRSADQSGQEGQATEAATVGNVPSVRTGLRGTARAPTREVLQQLLPGEGERRAPDAVQRQHEGPQADRPALWAGQPGLEGWCDLLQDARQLPGRQVRPLPCRVPSDGSEGWLRNGAPADRRSDHRPLPATIRGRPPQEPQPHGQCSDQPPTVRQQRPPQEVRGDGFTRAHLVTVEPVPYTGKVWCVRVPSGAFVARRNGQVFVTGNSGFPKSLDIAKQIDRKDGRLGWESPNRGQYGGDGKGFGARPFNDERPPAKRIDVEFESAEARQWQGWGTALKPAYEPILLARKPLSERNVAANVVRWGTGAINVDGCRVGDSKDTPASPPTNAGVKARGWGFGPGDMSQTRMNPNIGRWPANVLLDEEAAAMLDGQSGDRPAGGQPTTRGPDGNRQTYADGWAGGLAGPGVGRSTGGASRFFYTAKASRSEREAIWGEVPWRTPGEATGRQDGSAGLDSPSAGAGRTSGARNDHPTVKPIDLMRWLCRLITPPGGLILDPFCGSGTTGCAAVMEGFRFVGIDQDAHYCEIARGRIVYALGPLFVAE